MASSFEKETTEYLRYIFAIAIATAATGLHFLLLPIGIGPSFLFSYPAAYLAFYLYGLGPGLVSVLLCAFSVFFLPSDHVTQYSLISELIFTICASLIGITVIKRQENRYLQNEYQSLEFAVEGARFGIWCWDIKKNHLWFSDLCLAYFGLPRKSSMTYDHFLSLLHPHDRKRVHDVVQKCIKLHTPYSIDYRVLWPDGSEHWLNSLGRVRYSLAGAAERMDGAVIDITWRKKMEGELKRKTKQLAEISRHDPLTGLFNRLAINERLRNEFLRMKRTRELYSIIIIDIDHFKDVNDKYGHLVGDSVLKSLSATLKENLREYDCVGRFGGEEFFVLLPSTHANQAFAVAEKIRSSVASTSHPVAGIITVSIGVSTASPNHADEDEAVRLADDNLFRAKRNGRNRVAAE